MTALLGAAGGDSGTGSRRKESGREEGTADSGPKPDHSFPLLRRATVARLAQVWLQHLLPPPEDEGWAEAMRSSMANTLLQVGG